MRNTDFILNIYEKKSSLSKLASQLLYGETFTIQKNYTNWIKIKSKYDNNMIQFIIMFSIINHFHSRFTSFDPVSLSLPTGSDGNKLNQRLMCSLFL